MSAGHAYRDANGIGEGEIGSLCSTKINEVWKADQTLRWVHVGLLVSTDALERSDHELVSSLGVAHAAIGFAIPLIIGAEEELPARLKGPGGARGDIPRRDGGVQPTGPAAASTLS